MTADESHDVVVIGSGAGGGAAAWALTRAGARVLLLEAGPAYDPFSDYRLDAPDWEVRRFPEKLPVAGRQRFAPLQPLDDGKWSDLRSWNRVSGRLNRTGRRANWGYHHVVGLGGSTLHFTGEAHRLHPDAMAMATRFGVAADWPVSYDALVPYYQMAERIAGVAGPVRDVPRRRAARLPLPAHPFSHASQLLAKGFAAEGLGFHPNSLAVASQPYDSRPGCNYCNNCMRGCPRIDKGSVDVTFLRHAEETGRLTIRTQAQVLRVEAGADDRAASIIYADEKGARQRLRPRAVVVACGAVETPRLLLNSAGRHAPDGLGNDSGLVGRNFMETLAWGSSGLHPDPLGSHRGLPAEGICWDFNAPDAIPGVVGGCRFTGGAGEADLVGPVAYATRVVAGWGRDHKRRMRATFGRVLSISAVGESLPNPQSFVDLDPDPGAVDAHGMPKARIHAHLRAGDMARLAFMAKTARAILRAAGVADLVEEHGSYDAFNATHVFGTCRMGLDPAASVTDGFGRAHRWKNLWIADASLFPSSGGGEAPSLTIEALAIRAGENLMARASRGEI